jgi:2-dehydropantoate 2-reductase
MKIAVYGAGGVGGYFGGRLAEAGHDVRFIARGAHLAAIRSHGLTVRSGRGDFTTKAPATDDPTEIGACDAVLFCVKAYDTRSAAARLPALLSADTAVVTLQNGVDNEDILGEEIGRGHVLGGAAYIFAAITEPGTIVHTGVPAGLAFGELDGGPSGRAERLRAACEEAGIPAEVPPDIRVTLWSKLVLICGIAGMTAATRLPVGAVRDDPESWAMLRRLFTETATVGRAEGVPLPDTVVDQYVTMASGLDPQARSSLYHDLAAGRRLELEALHGTVVRRAREHGIAVPASEAVYAVLSPWAGGRESS